MTNNPQAPKRSSEELSRLRELRNRYQQDKPSIAELEAQGAEFATLGEITLLRCLAEELKHERESQGLTREQLSSRVKIPVESLVSLEAGEVGRNLTLGKLSQVAHALGKRIAYSLVEHAA